MTEDGGNKRDSYQPREYWSSRLGREWSLRGVGHHSFSEGYNRWIYRRKAQVLHSALPRARADERALDVGSGVGWVLDQLQRAGYRADGVDISPLAVTKLRDRFPDSQIEELAFGEGNLSAADATYAVVTILDVTYHVVSDDFWAAGLVDVSRVLRPGGLLLALDRFGGEDADPAPHVRFRSLARWEEQAAATGLQLQSIAPAYTWLSRGQGEGPLRRVPLAVRGPVEFALEQIPPHRPHMRLAVFRKAG